MARRKNDGNKFRPGPAMFRIAVLEDDRVMRQLLQQTLAADGFEVLLAATAAAGLKMCKEEKPDLILLDVHLPDGDGFELCRTMKDDEAVRHIPIVIMTGEVLSVESRIEGLEAGADDYLVKPFKIAELVSRIRGILKASTRPTHL